MNINSRHKTLIKNVTLLIFTVLILVLTLTHIDTKESTVKFKHLDKVAHFLMFFAYFIILNIKLKNNLKSIIISIILGATIEILQSNLPTGRSGDILDMAANILGILSASIFFKKIKRYLTAILSTLS